MTTSESASKCVCGHERRHHFGGGPCIGVYQLKSGQFAVKTVCPCLAFREE